MAVAQQGYAQQARPEVGARTVRQPRVAAALRELRECESSQALLDLAVSLPRTHLGFSATAIFEVAGDTLHLRPLSLPGGHEQEVAVRRAFLAAPPRLGDGPAETEVASTRSPALVTDAHPAIARQLGADAYVLAAFTSGDTVSLLYADRDDAGHAPDVFDRDVLDVFAETLTMTLERLELSERLQRVTRELRSIADLGRETIQRTESSNESVLSSLVAGEPSGADAKTDEQDGRAFEAQMQQLLSARELEVLKLMAEGRTNVAIASELVVAPSTIQSHVSAIFRKLGVRSRYQAIAHYLRHAA